MKALTSIIVAIFVASVLIGCGSGENLDNNVSNQTTEYNLSTEAKHLSYNIDGKEVNITVIPDESNELISYFWNQEMNISISNYCISWDENTSYCNINVGMENNKGFSFFAWETYDSGNIPNEINMTATSKNVYINSVKLGIGEFESIQYSTPMIKQGSYFYTLNHVEIIPNGVEARDVYIYLNNDSLPISFFWGDKSVKLSASDIIKYFKNNKESIELQLNISHENDDSAKGILDYQDYDSSKVWKMSIISTYYYYTGLFFHGTYQVFVNGKPIKEGYNEIYPESVIYIGENSNSYITSDYETYQSLIEEDLLNGLF